MFYKLSIIFYLSLFYSLVNHEERKKVKSLSRVRLFVTLWTVAYQVPPSMGFSRQEYQSALPFLLPGIFPTQESNPGLWHCRQMLYPLSHQEEGGQVTETE